MHTKKILLLILRIALTPIITGMIIIAYPFVFAIALCALFEGLYTISTGGDGLEEIKDSAFLVGFPLAMPFLFILNKLNGNQAKTNPTAK